MQCKKCGRELPDDARFCLSCGASVDDDAAEAIPSAKRLEEPLRPVGVGAVPMVPIAPPPRATRVMPRAARTHVAASGRGVPRAATPYEYRPAAAERAAAAGPVGAATAEDVDTDFGDDGDLERDAAAVGAQVSAHAAGYAEPEAGAAQTARIGGGAAGGGVFSPAAAAERGGLRSAVKMPQPSRRAVLIGVGGVVAVGLAVTLGRLATSWLGPLAPKADVPQVEPPDDGSIDPINRTDSTEASDQGSDAVPEGAPDARSKVEDYSWEELAAVASLIAEASSDADALKIAKSYNLVGSSGKLDGTQTKTLALSDGAKVKMRVAGFRADTLSDGGGKAGLTLVAADSLGAYAMNNMGQMSGGWKAATLRTQLGEGLADRLPEELAPLIAKVTKKTNPWSGDGSEVQDQTSDAIWVPSYSELVGELGSGSSRYSAYKPEGQQYQLFKDMGVDWATPAPAVGLAGGFWWLRSPDVSSDRWFMCVSPDGITSYGNLPATENEVLIGFCL